MSTEAVDVELETATGERRRLSEHRGRVVVLFWEDREHQTENTALKDELARHAADASLRREVVVVGVGDVSRFDFSPARQIVRAALGAVSRVAGIELWLDWTGALGHPPFGLAPGRSNVLVLDRRGVPVLARSGALGPTERRALLATVRSLLTLVAAA